mgnify:CR=1 FL=1
MTIPLWFVAAIAGLWFGLVLWQIFGKQAHVHSQDQKRLAWITGAGDAPSAMEIARKGLEEELVQAGLSLSATQFNLLRLVGVVGGLLVGPALGMPFLVGVALAAVSWFGARWFVRDRIRGRALIIEKELPTALARLSALLPLVTSMPQLLATVADSLVALNPTSPLAAELRRTSAELSNRGPEALADLEARAPSPALATLAFNLRIYLRAGGEQSELLADAARRLQRIIAGRNNARAKASGAMAVAKLLPLLLAGATVFTMSDPMIKAFFSSPAGQLVIIGVAVMMFIGYQVIKRMVEDVA